MSKNGEAKRLNTKESNLNANENLMRKIKATLEKEGISNKEFAEILGIEYKSISPYFSKSRGYIFPATYYIKLIKYIKNKKNNECLKEI